MFLTALWWLLSSPLHSLTASRGHITSGNSTEFGHYTGLGKGLARISICQALYSGQIQCYSHGICALCKVALLLCHNEASSVVCTTLPVLCHLQEISTTIP